MPSHDRDLSGTQEPPRTRWLFFLWLGGGLLLLYLAFTDPVGNWSRTELSYTEFKHQHVFLGKELTEPRKFSEQTAQLIDEEVREIIRSAEIRALDVLTQRTKAPEALARALLEQESLEQHEIEAMLECAS
jgi:hypothetical protein